MGQELMPVRDGVLWPRHDLPGLGNFAQISPTLYRGAQPTSEGFGALLALGIKTVVNLRAYHSDREELEGLGFRYVHLFCRAWLPRDQQVAAFLQIVAEPANGAVFVHCRHGADRTGCMVAAYRVIVQGWSSQEAAGELKRFGHHRMFPQIRRYLRRFDAATVNQLVRDRPMPPVWVVR